MLVDGSEEDFADGEAAPAAAAPAVPVANGPQTRKYTAEFLLQFQPVSLFLIYQFIYVSS
jgi:hypothetical protein